MPSSLGNTSHDDSSLITNAGPSGSGLKLLAMAGLIAAAAIVAYLPSLRGGFIVDDDLYITDSALVKASDGLYRFWFTTEPVDYWPLTNTSFWIEWRLWGLDTTGYHVTNLVLHIAGALLLWAVLRKLSIPGAWLAALLFAVHPVNVESVAWISQRKNVLSMLQFLLSILFYLKAERGVNRWYWLSLIAFTLAMLSKGSVMILPGVLLLIAWWQRDGIARRDVALTAPFFVVAVVLASVNVWFQTHGTGQTIRDVTLLQRLLGAGAAVWFYLFKALAPVDLAFVYPQWNVQATDWRWWVGLMATIGVTSVLVWQRNTRIVRPLLLAWLFFCIALLPVVGIADVGFMRFSLVADRYLHVAIIGVVALIAAGVSLLHQRCREPARSALLATAALAVSVCVVLSWKQSALYADAVGLYQATLAKNPDSWMVRNNLGFVLHELGRTDEAIAQFEQALALKPDYPEALNNRANLLIKTARYDEAIKLLRQALWIKPGNPQSHNNLGSALAAAGRLPEAIVEFELAVRIMPGYVDAHNNLGNAMFSLGRLDEACKHYEQALRLNPNYAEAHYNLGVALMNAGRTEDAMEQFQQALLLKPGFLDARLNFAAGLVQMGRLQPAIDQFEAILRLDPEFPDARFNLGHALEISGRLHEAIQSYQQAVQHRPDDLQAYLSLSVVQARLGQIAEAASTLQSALELAKSKGQTKLAEQIESRLNEYRSAQPGAKSEAPEPGAAP